MPLQSLGFAGLCRLGSQVATTSGHKRPCSAERCDRQRHCAIRTFFVIGSLFAIAHWHRACTLEAVRDGRHLMDETDSATNQFGAPEGAEDPRGTFPLFATGVCRCF